MIAKIFLAVFSMVLLLGGATLAYTYETSLSKNALALRQIGLIASLLGAAILVVILW